MNKGIVFVLFFVFLMQGLVGHSQTQLSIKEQQVFKEQVQQTAQQTQSIVSDFEQIRYLSVLENTITSQGTLVFKAADNIRWEYTAPFKYYVIFKDDKMLVNNEGKTDNINLSSNKLFRSFNDLLVKSIKGDMFDDAQFDIFYFKLKNGYLARFIPKEKRLQKYMAAFELTFTETSAEVTQVKLIEPNEDYTQIIFKNRKTNTKVSETAFEN